MAKATIIEDLGNGQYTIQRNWAGREAIEEKFIAYVNAAVELDAKYETMPQTTDKELFEKNIVAMQIASLLKKAEYLLNNMPVDTEVDAWCADHTEGLTGEVATIDIAGEFTSDVNIRPGYEMDEEALEEYKENLESEIVVFKDLAQNRADLVDLQLTLANPDLTPDEVRVVTEAISELEQTIDAQDRQLTAAQQELAALNEGNHYYLARDGELYPAIALGPWTSFLNQCIYPGWQKFKPLHRFGKIIEDSIDYENNTCSVLIQPTFSTHQFLNVNQGDTLGIEPAEGEVPAGYRNIDLFEATTAAAHSGFVDFVGRNPSHPISNVTELLSPIYMTDEQYVQISRICRKIDYFYGYNSDQSGYKVSDYWDVMYDIGDPWYWTPTYSGEPQQEFTFGDVSLDYDNSGLVVGIPDANVDESFQYGTYTQRNVELEYQANRLPVIGPNQKRLGDCEDFVLTKMQAIIEAGIVPAGNLQIMLCWIVNASSFGDISNWTTIGTTSEIVQIKKSDMSNLDPSNYHAVLGIQTANRGFLISDQRDYGQLFEIEQLKNTHIWDVMSVTSA